MIRVTENLQIVRETMQNAARVAARPLNDITLIAVSKRQSTDAIRAAISAGQRHFGENFVDEACEKIAELGRKPLVWHFIGALQSNKTRAVAENFDWIHTIDRAKIARRLCEQRPANMSPLQTCIQVNIDNEPQKAGVDPEKAYELAEFIASRPNLELRGLMCLPKPDTSLEQQRLAFKRLRMLQVALRETHPTMDSLSMGMSNDLTAAVLEGSTMIRIGTAIFGSRS